MPHGRDTHSRRAARRLPRFDAQPAATAQCVHRSHAPGARRGARIGLVPDSGGTWFLPRLVGAARARGLALLAEPLPAEKAEEWGLIWKAVDDALLMVEAEKLCAHFARGPTVGLALAKRALDAA